MDNEVLINIVNKALDNLYKEDYILIKNNVQEESIVSAFTRYFEKEIETMNLKKKYLSIDNEYNKDILSESGFKEIYYEGKSHNIKPDFILHERGTNNNNILVIEFKKMSNNDVKGRKSDKYKLIILTDNKLKYKYQLGLFIDLSTERNKTIIKKYINGKIV